MMNPLPAYTPRQLETFKVLQRNRMAWIMFWFLLFVFALILGGFMYAVVSGKGGRLIWGALLLLDGIVGWSIKIIVSYLFPPICRGKSKLPDQLGPSNSI